MTFDPRITFSRASLGTCYGADGLLRYAAHNLALQSQTFDNASWTKATSVTITADATTAPDGTTTADRLNWTGAGTTALTYLGQSGLVIPYAAIVSIYAKAGSKPFLMIGSSTSTAPFQIWFNLTAGTMGTVGAGAGVISGAMSDAGNGWYRCSALMTAAGWGTTAYFRPGETNGSVNCTSPGDIYLWGAQYEYVTTATTPSTYLPTTVAAVHGPRLDYDPVTHVAKGLLIEEQRVNTILQGQNLSDGAWTKTGLAVTVDQIAAPDGTVTADLVTASATTATISVASNGASAGVNYVQSIFARKGTSDWIYMIGQDVLAPKAWFNLAAGTVGTIEAGLTTATIQNVGNGWFRCAIADVGDTGVELLKVGLCDADNISTVTVGRTAYLWGGQHEINATFASSYMPPITSGTFTRAADVAVMTGTDFSSWYNQPAGTFVVEFDTVLGAFGRGIMGADNNTTGHFITFYKNSVGNARADVNTAGGSVYANNIGTVAAGVNKLGLSFALNDFAGCLNGGTVSLDTLGAVPTPTQLRIGTENNSNTILNGHVRRIRFFNVAKTDAELIVLTTLPTAMPVVSLAWTTPDDDTTPSFTVTFTGAAVGDVLELQVDDDYLFGSLFATESLTLNSTQVAAGTVTMGATIPALSLGVTYNARVRVTR